MFLILAPEAVALPASARLFQQSYGYKTSCLLCHTNGGGSASNIYGKAFLKAGANALAFKKIETVDSDGDSLANLVEITAKSNPGDKKSTASSPGDWLANAGNLFIPQKELEKLFPGFEKFSAIEGSLSIKQIEWLKEKLGRNPPDDDKVPTFYFAEKNGKRAAVGQFIAESLGEAKGLNIGVAVATTGKILSVKILGGSEAKSAEANKAYLDALKEKTAASLPVAPANSSAQLINKSVERSLYLIQSVFGGSK